MSVHVGWYCTETLFLVLWVYMLVGTVLRHFILVLWVYVLVGTYWDTLFLFYECTCWLVLTETNFFLFCECTWLVGTYWDTFSCFVSVRSWLDTHGIPAPDWNNWCRTVWYNSLLWWPLHSPLHNTNHRHFYSSFFKRIRQICKIFLKDVLFTPST